NFLERSLAARLLAVADDVENAASSLGLSRQCFGCIENRVIERMNLLGRSQKSTPGVTLRVQVGIDRFSVDHRTGRQWSARDRHAHLAALPLRPFQRLGQQWPL